MRPLLLFGFLPTVLLAAASAKRTAAEPLPGTQLLTEDGDLAQKQVAGMHRYLDRELAAAPAKRDTLWKDDLASPEQLAKSLPAKRERLHRMLGVVEPRERPNLEYIGGPGKPSLVKEFNGCKLQRVRWAVLPGVDAEGFLFEPKGQPKANVILLNGLGEIAEHYPADWGLALHGCRVLVPTLINRRDELSRSTQLKRQTNIPHREFLHRMSFTMGRTLLGYEVQKVLAGVDWFETQSPRLPIGVVGYSDGGAVAFYAGALDPRIRTTAVQGYFRSREKMPEEPIDRNVWGILREFGDAEVARFFPAGRLHLQAGPVWPKWNGPVQRPGIRGGAPGALEPIPQKEAFDTEVARIAGKPGTEAPVTIGSIRSHMLRDLGVWMSDAFDRDSTLAYLKTHPQPVIDLDYTARHQRQFNQLVAYNQKLWRDSEARRKLFWKQADARSLESWEKSCESYRRYFHEEVIGKLPEPTIPLNPRARKVYDEQKFIGYEVMLDVYPDVNAHGILLLPKDMKPGEKRPVIVCQHGLEGTPRHTIDVEKRIVYNHFSRRLVEQGFIVYAPQNPYYGQNDFRQLQRKANPLKLSIFSFIVRQHQRTLDWLASLPQVDPKRMAFYGLSYGGKTAMRVPAIEKRYCLSICSGDFNEWIGKNVSVTLDRSYMWTHEYEMYEFDLGNTFNYAEMAYLIAPRPFMVERGHDDGVGTDEMVAYEYARVRYLYANRLKIANRTEIEWFVGVHQIHAQGTFAFLKKHLAYPKE